MKVLYWNLKMHVKPSLRNVNNLKKMEGDDYLTSALGLFIIYIYK